MKKGTVIIIILVAIILSAGLVEGISYNLSRNKMNPYMSSEQQYVKTAELSWSELESIEYGAALLAQDGATLTRLSLEDAGRELGEAGAGYLSDDRYLVYSYQKVFCFSEEPDCTLAAQLQAVLVLERDGESFRLAEALSEKTSLASGEFDCRWVEVSAGYLADEPDAPNSFRLSASGYFEAHVRGLLGILPSQTAISATLNMDARYLLAQ